MSKRVMFYVQHLLGIGHVKRAAAIARGLKDQGFDVTMVLGGPPVALVDLTGISVHQLPAVRASNASFDMLVDDQDQLIDDKWREARKGKLLQVYRDIRPDVLIVELFPFGRRQFRFELIPLLGEAGDCIKVCSVRDVLVGKADVSKNRWIVATARAHFDHIFVHGDKAVIPLEESFPNAGELYDLIRYTGYVVDQAPSSIPPDSTANGEVIVSIGGGAVGEKLLRTAIEAASNPELVPFTWRLLVGENLDGGVFDELKQNAPAGVVVERARADFLTLLTQASLSISQGGYNTVMDLLAADCKNVVVPFAAGSESEQSHRARAFAKRGLMTVLSEECLTAGTLALAALEALNGNRPSVLGIDMSGVETTAKLLDQITCASGIHHE